jgi:hypothetical protein
MYLNFPEILFGRKKKLLKIKIFSIFFYSSAFSFYFVKKNLASDYCQSMFHTKSVPLQSLSCWGQFKNFRSHTKNTILSKLFWSNFGAWISGNCVLFEQKPKYRFGDTFFYVSDKLVYSSTVISDNDDKSQLLVEYLWFASL